MQLASTLVANPDIVILDEPFSGLDPVNSQILKDIVQSLIEENRIVIFSSHQMGYVEEFCENIAIINHGEIVLEGELSKIKQEFGKNQLVLNAENYSVSELKNYLEENFVNEVSIIGTKKEFVIISLNENMTKKDLLTKLLDSPIEIERFENYKPSLNDIFVAKAGDE